MFTFVYFLQPPLLAHLFTITVEAQTVKRKYHILSGLSYWKIEKYILTFCLVIVEATKVNLIKKA